MSIERSSLVALLASVVFATGLVRGQDFNERYAAWQGRAMTQRVMPQAVPEEEVGGLAEAVPSGPATGQQRILSSIYSPPLHQPDYNRPMTSSPCASCSHNPGFVPASDPLGTCNWTGGQGVDGIGGYGGCGPDGCGGGCGPCGACGGAGGGCDFGPLCSNPIVWARFELLLWWRKGHSLPPIVTTDPTTESSTTAGILPDAQILFGGGNVASSMQAGGRFDFGFFIDPTQSVGIGDRFFGLGKDASNFNATSNNVPVLAIPFFDRPTNANEAFLVAYPGLRAGTVNAASTSSVLGNDVYARILLCRDCNLRLDFITGWNYTRVADEFQLNTRARIISDPTLPAGTVINTLDRFTAHNDFNGGILGLQWQRNCGCWTWQTLTRVSLGNMHETLLINGETRANGTVVANPTTGGIFTRPSNIGQTSRDEFTAITELGANLGYRFSPCTQLNIGYTFIFWNDILQAGPSIDPFVGTANGTDRPQPIFRHSNFWVQGINLGLTREF